jgi:dTDP-4-dehydrorhamnose 3,5-epimerase
MIDGVQISSLKKISHPKGDIFHALKQTDDSYNGFGEAYFSFVSEGAIKGWKKHTKMVLNLIVPQGAVKFVIYDDREDSRTKGVFMDVELSPMNYQRLTVQPNLWVAFQGKGPGSNMLLNVASIAHDPSESCNAELGVFNYCWS